MVVGADIIDLKIDIRLFYNSRLGEKWKIEHALGLFSTPVSEILNGIISTE